MTKVSCQPMPAISWVATGAMIKPLMEMPTVAMPRAIPLPRMNQLATSVEPGRPPNIDAPRPRNVPMMA